MKNAYADHLERLYDRDRAQVFNLIHPAGWAFHLRHTYQIDRPGPPMFGVCWHGHVCVATMHGWIHPVTTIGRTCDDPPVLVHSGDFVTLQRGAG